MKTNHRVFHSFWSNPLLGERFDQTIVKQLKSTLLFTAIGVIALKKLDIDVVLHTDDYGIKLFEILPYNEIYLTLRGHEVNKCFWASGKMIALEKEPLGACHLDLDAWIKQPECRDIIFNSKADIVIQSLEDNQETYQQVRDTVIKNIDVFDHIDMSIAKNFKAYNCGIIKINNQELKDMWLNGYWSIINQLSEKNIIESEDNFFIPDLIAEQWLLYQLCQQNNFCVETLCKGWGCSVPTEIGYTHLIGESKYKMDVQLKGVLKKLDENIYFKTVSHIKKLVLELDRLKNLVNYY